MSRRSEPKLSVILRGGAASLAVVLASSQALAETAETEPIALVYEAKAAKCPSQSDFFAAVRLHTNRWSAVPEGTKSARTIRVRLAPRGRETVGTLVVADATGTLSERTIVGPSCDGVSQALAIMVGVAIDPLAGTPSETREPPAAETIPDEPRDEPPPRVVLVGRRRVPLRTPPPPRPALAFDLRIETTSAIVRGSLLGLGASMTISLPITTGPSWLQGLRPSLGLGFRQSFPKERSLRGGDVEFLWTAGGLRACPHQLTVVRIVEVAPCAEMNLGILRASAEGFSDARQASITWFDLGGSVWAAVRLSEHLFLSSTILVTAPFSRRPFVLASGTTAASVPAVGLLGGLGIGTRM